MNRKEALHHGLFIWSFTKICVETWNLQDFDQESPVQYINSTINPGWVFDEPGMCPNASINITVMGSDQLSLQNLRCNWTDFMIFHIISLFESLFFAFRAKLGQESGQSSSTPMTPQRARLYNRKGDASRRCQWLHRDRDEKWRGWEGGRWKSIEAKGFFSQFWEKPWAFRE